MLHKKSYKLDKIMKCLAEAGYTVKRRELRGVSVQMIVKDVLIRQSTLTEKSSIIEASA